MTNGRRPGMGRSGRGYDALYIRYGKPGCEISHQDPAKSTMCNKLQIPWRRAGRPDARLPDLLLPSDSLRLQRNHGDTDTPMPSHRVDGLGAEQLVKLYQGWGQPDRAAATRKGPERRGPTEYRAATGGLHQPTLPYLSRLPQHTSIHPGPTC